MQKPSRIFFSFLLFFAIIALLGWIFPREGLKVGNLFTLRMWSPSSLFENRIDAGERVKKLLANAALFTDTLQLSTALSVKTPKDMALDSLIRMYRDTVHTNICFFEYPREDSTVLFPFFAKLKKSVNGKAVHILHYGDSQIEADRITSYLRKRFQNDFGGHGIGLFSLNNIQNFSHFVVGETSSNCTRYGTNGMPVNKTGILASLTRFNHSIQTNDSLETKGNFIRLSLTGKMKAREQQYSQCRILFGPINKTTLLQFTNGDYTEQLELPPTTLQGMYTIPIPSPARKMEFRFLTNTIPDIFALSLDDTSGVQVDNIPLRGAAMVNFKGMDPQLFEEADSLLNIGLVILQFGVNVASNVVKSYSYYRDIIVREVQDLRKNNPSITIILMGVSDVAGKNGSGFETMKNIELIRDAQREAAASCGCVFWDTFKAMGGKNSMPVWVANNPPLAQKDFIHFTPKGADLIGEMFYNAIMLDYFKYLEMNKKNED